MLKITTHSAEKNAKVTLEGRLAGPWVEELARCWRQIVDSAKGSVLVDLTGVTFIEPEGKALLAKMWQQGAEFHAVGCLNRCIIEDITKADRANSSRSSRKDKRKGS